MIFAGLTSDFGPYWSLFAMRSGKETSQQTPCESIFFIILFLFGSCCCDQVQSRQFCLRKSWQIWCKSWWILLPACRKGCVRIATKGPDFTKSLAIACNCKGTEQVKKNLLLSTIFLIPGSFFLVPFVSCHSNCHELPREVMKECSKPFVSSKIKHK